MNDITVAAVQRAAAQAWQDEDAVASNLEAIKAAYLGIADDADLVVFPELALTGYIPLKGYDQRRKRVLAGAAREARDAIDDLVDATAGRRAVLTVGFMEPATARHEIFNSVALIEGGELRGVYRKAHLPVEENHYFTPGGPALVADTGIGRIGVVICYDLLFPEITRQAALRGAQTLVVPSNWLGIAHLRRLGEVLPPARALEGQCHVVFVNGVGDLEVRGRTWSLYGTSRLVSALGETVAVGGEGPETVVGVLPGSDLEEASDVFPVARDRRPELYGDLIRPQTDFASFEDDR